MNASLRAQQIIEPAEAVEAPAIVPMIEYAGSTKALFALCFKNLLLTIATLGIYRFWATTRTRRFLWASTRVGGEPLEYTGTGKELFFGFLIAAAILIPTFGGLALAEFLLVDDSPAAFFALTLFRSVLILVLVFAGIYAASRYVMSRTRWRGIRFAQTGSAWAYAGRSLLGVLMTAVTLGLFYPVMQIWQTRYLTNTMRFGSAQFAFTGRARQLYGRFLLCYAIGVFLVVTFVAAMVAISIALAAGGRTPDPENPVLQAVSMASAVAVMLIGQMLFTWYQAKFLRVRAEQTRLEGISFSMPTISGMKLIRLMYGNFLLLAVSFGLLYPLTVQRTMRFWTRHLRIAGQLDFARVSQAERGPRIGEGLAGMLGG